MSRNMMDGIVNQILDMAVRKAVAEVDPLFWSGIILEVIDKELPFVDAQAVLPTVLERFNKDKYYLDINTYFISKDDWEGSPDAFTRSFE